MAMQRLKEAAERAKKDLSQQTTADINLPFITADASGPKHLQMSITRSKFEQLVEHLIDRCRRPVMQAMQDAGYKPGQVDEVVLVGGMTRMPRVQQLVKEIFGKEGHKGVNPDEVVAIGAASRADRRWPGWRPGVCRWTGRPLWWGLGRGGAILRRRTEGTRPIQKKPRT